MGQVNNNGFACHDGARAVTDALSWDVTVCAGVITESILYVQYVPSKHLHYVWNRRRIVLSCSGH